MNQDNNNVVKSHISDSNESIDIIDIFMQLRRGKWILLAFVILTTVIAAIYLFVAKEKWTSEAIVTYPDSGQIVNYDNAMNVLYSQSPGGTPSVIDIQQRFFGRFYSSISALSEQLNNQEVKESLVAAGVSKDQSMPVRISYTSKNAADAQKTLTTYIQQINKRVVTELDNDLQVSIDSKLSGLKQELQNKEKVAQEKKDTRLKVLNQALIIAEQSNIKTPVVQQAESLSEDTLFVLGSNALSATIKNESTRPLPLDDSYFNTRQLFLSVSALKAQSTSTYAIRYIMKPTLPIKPDNPKKPLVVILGVLAGLIIGSIVVLSRNAVRKYAAKS